ncbi:hypothetical protein [Streptomyces djakartensis]|uniref:TetR family transcriptional regulator n=1 Tax=Streptomyces djakartensis TaxID=68193 RepID=A0ABQ3A595_9ACTN|nr:hypothetical protein [Streptomyces djakartensis]GGY35726.1 hypothetical protein GCM10010384_48770 [Streptomyces djakartensis]
MPRAAAGLGVQGVVEGHVALDGREKLLDEWAISLQLLASLFGPHSSSLRPDTSRGRG